MKAGFTHESTYNESKEWYTPKFIFDKLNIEFDLDPASPGQAIVPWIPVKKHLTLYDNGLMANWQGKVWLNPPYGMDTPTWLKRLRVHGNGIALVFSRTDTNWFHEYAIFANVLCFIQGRIKFISADKTKITSTPGAGSLMIAYGNECANALWESDLGWCVDGLGSIEAASKHSEKFRGESDFAGGSRSPYGHLPRNAESGLDLFRKEG